MSMTHAEAPIYDGLIEERGDVPASVRETAEETLRSLEADFDFSGLRASAS
ncbi:hypothetical protein [Streptomyces apocyni]|uniref:hypothetical protein n=1 Tax=Streptomyces apocyni TaxID=2654677 RepID=UPI0012E9D5E9|nr:hypothetical protein [Streptomyces apocyni]